MEGTVSERPTMAQAFAADVAPVAASLPADTSTEGTTADSASADATVPPAISASETPINPSTDAADGPMPLERHKKILDGVYKERDDAKTQLDGWKAFEWAKSVDRTAVETAQKLGQLFQTDRAGYIRQLLSEAAADPQFAPIVRSEAARALAAGRGAQAPSFEPDIPVYDNQGQLVSQTFSAGKVHELIKHSVAEALGKELSPLKADFESRQQREQAEQSQRDMHATTDKIYAHAREILPHFQEHEAEIGKVFGAMTGTDLQEDLHKAWKQVVGPKLSAKATADVLDSLKTKAAATTVNPSSAVVAATKRPTSLTDKSLKW